MKKFKPFILIAIVIIFIIAFINEKGEVVENLLIPVGAGYDIEDFSSDADIDYIISLFMHYKEDENITRNNLIVSKGKNIGETREKRQLKADKRVLLGLSRIQIISESMARFGIKNILDTWTNNPQLNDRGICIVCKGKAKDIINYPVEGNVSAVEHIEGMVTNLKQFNFFPMQYSILDLIVRVDAEGRNVLLPYIEVTDDGLKVTGLAIFKGDKLVAVADLDEARIINILKEKSVKGMFTIQKDSMEYINFYTTSKRKVKCNKQNEKYSFTIDLELKGQITSNLLDKNLLKESKEIKKYEENMENEVKEKINVVLKKMKEDYRTDFLGLGKFAAGKYGRGTGVDWNQVVSDSDIEVNVKFSIDTEGRGSY